MMIARNRGLAIHHVAVQAIAGRLSVSVDLEVEGTMALNAAHEVASGLEEAMREELGPEVEVETHIEPLPADVLAGRDASAARIAEVREALASLAAEIASSRRSARRARARDPRRRDRQFSLPGRSGAFGRRRARRGRRARAPAAAALSLDPARHRPRRAAAVDRPLSIRPQNSYIKAIMRTEEHRPIRLQDYRPPDWLIETVDLDVSLHPTATTRPRQAQAQAQHASALRRRSCSTARS